MILFQAVENESNPAAYNYFLIILVVLIFI